MRLFILTLLLTSTLSAQHSEVRDCIDWCSLPTAERLKRPTPKEWNCPADCSNVSPDSEDVNEDPNLDKKPIPKKD